MLIRGRVVTSNFELRTSNCPENHHAHGTHDPLALAALISTAPAPDSKRQARAQLSELRGRTTRTEWGAGPHSGRVSAGEARISIRATRDARPAEMADAVCPASGSPS
jgi:hypothetical protein